MWRGDRGWWGGTRRARTNASKRCAAISSIRSSPQPILAKKAVDPRKLPLVVGDDGITERDRLSGDKQIVAADWPSDLFDPGADQGISGIGGRLAGGNTQSVNSRPTKDR